MNSVEAAHYSQTHEGLKYLSRAILCASLEIFFPGNIPLAVIKIQLIVHVYDELHREVHTSSIKYDEHV